MGPPAATLLDEHLEEVLFRLPPDDPAGLVRAALVCKRWRRVVSDPGFRRRFRQFHRAPPLLGFLCNVVADDEFTARFVPTTTSFRPLRTEHPGMRVVDSRHGRVLLSTYALGSDGFELVVWDPVTDEQRALPPLPQYPGPHVSGWNAAVLCAAHGACDHLDCHRGAFLVVLVVALVQSGVYRDTFLRAYSSENGAWSEPVPFQLQQRRLFSIEPSPLVDNSLHFRCYNRATILKYNVVTREIAVIQLPPEAGSYTKKVLLMAAEDGRLGFAGLNKSTLSLWSREIGQNGDARWAQRRDIKLNTPLLKDVNAIFAVPFPPTVGFADGADTIFIGTGAGVFKFDLKSGQVIKPMVLIEDYAIYDVVPFASFCTPALGAISTGEGPEAGASNA